MVMGHEGCEGIKSAKFNIDKLANVKKEFLPLKGEERGG
jgi:hypothetical protein